ncbi:hypothetical protein QVD17_04801 [Tagetes erecta]|uniref:Uncharacterized protein n=1 Tax=Tagetes erecta TaxID=13708 RepID=A0AAD8LIG4_TARER|nr:hypothetical protein QVD17_04801 [Tagetes erecta]
MREMRFSQVYFRTGSNMSNSVERRDVGNRWEEVDNGEKVVDVMDRYKVVVVVRDVMKYRKLLNLDWYNLVKTFFVKAKLSQFTTVRRPTPSSSSSSSSSENQV